MLVHVFERKIGGQNCWECMMVAVTDDSLKVISEHRRRAFCVWFTNLVYDQVSCDHEAVAQLTLIDDFLERHEVHLLLTLDKFLPYMRSGERLTRAELFAVKKKPEAELGSMFPTVDVILDRLLYTFVPVFGEMEALILSGNVGEQVVLP